MRRRCKKWWVLRKFITSGAGGGGVFFAQRLRANATILVADFGGGTKGLFRGSHPRAVHGWNTRRSRIPLASASLRRRLLIIASSTTSSRAPLAKAPSTRRGQDPARAQRLLHEIQPLERIVDHAPPRDYRELQQLEKTSTTPGEKIRAFLKLPRQRRRLRHEPRGDGIAVAQPGRYRYRCRCTSRVSISNADQASSSRNGSRPN